MVWFKNLKLDSYFVTIIYMSFIVLILSLFYETALVVSNVLIAKISSIWLLAGIFLWLLNDILDLHGRRLDIERKQKSDKVPLWTYIVMLIHILIFIIVVTLTIFWII